MTLTNIDILYTLTTSILYLSINILFIEYIHNVYIKYLYTRLYVYIIYIYVFIYLFIYLYLFIFKLYYNTLHEFGEPLD